MTLNLDELKEDVYVTKGMVRAEFDFWVGIPMDKFLDALEQEKLIGNKCPKCGKVFCPPRKICGDCFVQCDEYVDLPNTGVVKNFTWTKFKIEERKSRERKKPNLVGLVQVDGADNAMIIPIENAKAEDLEDGMKVEAVFGRRKKGSPEDLKGFAPVGGE